MRIRRQVGLYVRKCGQVGVCGFIFCTNKFARMVGMDGWWMQAGRWGVVS